MCDIILKKKMEQRKTIEQRSPLGMEMGLLETLFIRIDAYLHLHQGVNITAYCYVW